MNMRGVWYVALAGFLAGCSPSSPPPAQLSTETEPATNLAAGIIDARDVMAHEPAFSPAIPDSGLLSYTRRARAFEKERVITLYFQARQAARAALDQGRFDEARRQAQYALDLVDQQPDSLAMPEAGALHDATTEFLKMTRALQEMSLIDQPYPSR
jgi:hypothetical protein